MAIKRLPDIEYLHSILSYDPDSGKLFWKERGPHTFSTSGGRSITHAASLWNSRHAGKEAMTAVSKQGYRVGNINSSLYRAHRIAWALHYGEDPENQIDHINGIRTDNRIENLRVVTNKENSWNQKLRSTNKSGYNGVSWCKMMNKWVARATVNGVEHKIGYFSDPKDASIAREAFNKGVGFHKNHGIDRCN
jgi:hypothetical protein